MRKNLAIYQASPRRLSTLPLIVILVAFITLSVVESSFIDSAERKAFIRECSKSPPHTKVYKVQSACSKRFVAITARTRKKVYARSPSTDIYTDLKFTAHRCANNTVIMRIQGAEHEDSLCMNSKGRLIQKDDRVFPSPRCFFIEGTTPGKGVPTFLVSAMYDNFRVGFNKRGMRIRGDRWRTASRCFYFHTIPSSGYGGGSSSYSSFSSEERVRHQQRRRHRFRLRERMRQRRNRRGRRRHRYR